MIVEKRTRIRKSTATEPVLPDKGNSTSPANLADQDEEPSLNFHYAISQSADWEDELDIEHEVTSSCIVVVFIILTGFSAFAMGSYFFTC